MIGVRLEGLLRQVYHSRAARNAAAAYFAFASSAVCGFVSIPIAVSYLHKEEIGLWTVINTFVGYLLWMDLGVGEATGRKMADAIAHRDQAEMNRWWTTSITVLSIQGLLMLVVGMAIAPWLGLFLRLDGGLAEDASFLFIGVVSVVACGMPVRAYPGILMAQDRFHWVPLAQGLIPWVQLAVFVAQLRCGWGVRSYVLAGAVAWPASWLLFIVQAHRRHEHFAFDGSGLTRSRLNSLFHYSGSVLIKGVAATVIQTLPSLMLARMGGLGTVPTYAFSGQGPGMLHSLTARTAHAFYPNLQRMYVLRERDRFAMKYKAVNLLAVGMSLVAAGAVIAGNRSVVEWLADTDYFAGPLANGWLAVSVILLSLLASFSDLLQISGSMGRIAVLSLLQLAGGIVFTWLGFRWAGLAGIAAAVALVPISFQGPYSLLRGAANCGLKPRQIAAATTLLAATGCGATIALSWWLSTLSIEADAVTILQRTTRLPTPAEWVAGLTVALPGLATMARQLYRLRRI